MKKLLMAVGAIACVGVGATIGVVAASGTPEIDRANATFQLSGNLTPVRCPGEDVNSAGGSIPYETFSGSYMGGESQVMPDPTDYSLSGKVSITGVSWTINLSTKRGVFSGVITLFTTTSPPAISYRGSITLITQGVPASGAAPVNARGWINAKFVTADDGIPPTASNPNDDSLLANTEFKLTPSSAVGQFGDLAGAGPGTLGFKDLSVVTNEPVAPEGRC